MNLFFKSTVCLGLFIIIKSCASIASIPNTYKMKISKRINNIGRANNLIQSAMIRDGFTIKRNDHQLGILESDLKSISIKWHNNYPPKIKHSTNLIVSKTGVEIITNYQCSEAYLQGSGFSSTFVYGPFGECTVAKFGKSKELSKYPLPVAISRENKRLRRLVAKAISRNP